MLAKILAYNKSALCQNASPAFSFVLLIDSFLAPRGYFFPRDPLNQLEISARHRMRVETIFEGLPGKHSLSPRVSPSFASVLSCALYFLAPASVFSQGQQFHRVCVRESQRSFAWLIEAHRVSRCDGSFEIGGSLLKLTDNVPACLVSLLHRFNSPGSNPAKILTLTSTAR